MDQQLAAAGEFVAAMPVGEKTKTPDAWEPIGQGVEEKTADELAGSQSHDARFLAAVAAVVLPLKRDD